MQTTLYHFAIDTEKEDSTSQQTFKDDPQNYRKKIQSDSQILLSRLEFL